ncbi:MAG: hypothetical protein OHK0046_03600 [Anaerolineae bacterium]
MTTPKTLTLTTTWIPRGELARVQRYWPVLRELYDHLVMVILPETLPDIIQAARALPDVRLHEAEVLGTGRYLAVKHALAVPTDVIHYVDMDRLVRWVETRPSELRETVAALRALHETDYLMLGRTDAAMRTHPQALQKTEVLIDTAFTHLLGSSTRYDFCSGSKAFSQRAAEFIAAHGAPDYGLGTDTEWAVLMHRGGFNINQMRVDGLDWETADRFRDAAADEALQRAEAARMDADAAQWEARTELAHQMMRAGLDALARELDRRI